MRKEGWVDKDWAVLQVVSVEKGASRRWLLMRSHRHGISVPPPPIINFLRIFKCNS